MRNMVRILTAGALVGCLSAGLAYADGKTVPTFKVKALQKAILPGSTVDVQVRLDDVTDLGALQFMMKTSGGEQGTLTVVNIVMNKERPDYVFGTAQTFAAIDEQQWRAGAVLMNGGRDFESASVATVTLRASQDAAGTFQVNLAKGEETFLRNSNAGAIAVLIGQATTITVSDRATPSRVNKREKSR